MVAEDVIVLSAALKICSKIRLYYRNCYDVLTVLVLIVIKWNIHLISFIYLFWNDTKTTSSCNCSNQSSYFDILRFHCTIVQGFCELVLRKNGYSSIFILCPPDACRSTATSTFMTRLRNKIKLHQQLKYIGPTRYISPCEWCHNHTDDYYKHDKTG